MMKSDFNVFTGRICKIVHNYFANLLQSRNLIIKVIDCYALLWKKASAFKLPFNLYYETSIDIDEFDSCIFSFVFSYCNPFDYTLLIRLIKGWVLSGKTMLTFSHKISSYNPS